MILAIFLTLAAPPAIEAQWVRDDGLAGFWKLHDTWTADGTVTEQQWEALFRQPGYLQLDANEQRGAWMKPIFEMALRPSQEAEARQRIAQGDMVGQILIPHIRQVSKRRKQIETLARDLNKRRVVHQAIVAAGRYLPDSFVNSKLVPTVHLVILDGDGKAFSDSIVVDAATLSYVQEPALFLGHELHHIFRRQIDRVPLDAVADRDRMFVALLIKLEEEGIADLIDKSDTVLAERSSAIDPSESIVLAWMWKQYLEIYADAPDLIRELDAGLRAVADDASHAEAQGKRISKLLLRLTGRPIGMFMANAVDQEFGRDRVRSVVRNPFAFIRAYAAAAARGQDRLPQISLKALGVIENWEKKYLK